MKEGSHSQRCVDTLWHWLAVHQVGSQPCFACIVLQALPTLRCKSRALPASTVTTTCVQSYTASCQQRMVTVHTHFECQSNSTMSLWMSDTNSSRGCCSCCVACRHHQYACKALRITVLVLLLFAVRSDRTMPCFAHDTYHRKPLV